MDLFYVLLALGFVALTLATVAGCQRLQKS
jgi:hypothetical protein